MYQLYYGTIKAPNPLIANVRLLGGDTDSFFLEIRVNRVKRQCDELIASLTSPRDKVFALWRDKLDSSNYPPTHPLFSNINKARLTCFKDETGGKDIEEIVSLRPKMYSIKFRGQNTSPIKRAKGVGRAQVADFTHDDFYLAYHNAKVTKTRMTILRSVNHTIQTVTISKKALSAWDDKRYWGSANESLPFGHYKTVASADPQLPIPPDDD